MLIDIAIYQEDIRKPVKNWNNIRLIHYKPKTFRWQLDFNLCKKNKFRMVVTEKANKLPKTTIPEDEFTIYIGK